MVPRAQRRFFAAPSRLAGQGRGLRVVALALCLLSGAWAVPAQGASNPFNTSIPSSGSASPYPSVINVSGLPGTVTKVTVSFRISHTFPSDVDVLLVGPSGQKVMLMSDAGGSFDVTSIDLTFDDAAALALPQTNQIFAGTYRPTNYGGAESLPFPAPTAPYSSTLSAFNGTTPNGPWQLFVRDEFSPDAGTIFGWSLAIRTQAGNGETITLFGGGAATPYPSTIPISGLSGTIQKVTATLHKLTEPFGNTFAPARYDILLVGPGGETVVLMSDAGVGSQTGVVTFTFDDAAATVLPSTGPLVSGTFRPTNYGVGDTFPAPAPAAPYGATLAVFTGKNPNGTWRLYAVGDDVGCEFCDAALDGGWSLSLTLQPDLVVQSIATNPTAPVANQSVSVTVTIKNQGTGPASTPFVIDFYKNLPTAPGPAQVGDFFCNVSSLAAGATTQCSGSVSYASIGTFQMWGQVDTGRAVVETNEGNNVFGPQAITVQATPILSVMKAGSGTGTVRSSPAGIDCGTRCSASYALGTPVTLTATADPGSMFTGFTGDLDCADGAVTMSGARSCTATFVRVFTLSMATTGAGSGTVASLPAGITCPPDCTEVYPVGTVVTLQPMPASGSHRGAFSGDPDCVDGVVRLTTDVTCTFEFRLTPPPAPLALLGRASAGLAGEPSNGASVNSSVSGDGILIAFESSATNLDPARRCTNGLDQVFLRNRVTGEIRCLSVGADGTPGNGPSGFPAISADGAFVAFQSAATNLAAGCTNGLAQILLVHVATGAMTCVSLGADSAPGNGPSGAPAISADGAFVVFQSIAMNLVSPCDTGLGQVFRWTRATGALQCVSVGGDGTPGDGPSGAPAVSADGGVVAFESTATNLASPCTTGVGQILAADLGAGSLACESVGSGGAGNAASAAPSLSADGILLAFQSSATNLADPCTNGLDQIFLRNRAAGTTRCVTVGPDGSPGNGPSRDPMLSGNGLVLVFATRATNLVSGSSAALRAGPLAQSSLLDQILSSDLVQQGFQELTQLQGASGNGGSRNPSTSTDGSVTSFQTTATNLAPDDGDAAEDVQFVVSADQPPAGQATILAPVSGTQFLIVPGGVTTVRVVWTSVQNAAQYALAFSGPGGIAGTVVVPGTTLVAPLTDSIVPGAYEVRVIGLSAAGVPGGTLSDPVTVVLNVGFPTDGDRPTFSAPADGAAVARGAAVTFAWTPVPGASAYGVEFTGADRHFSNPNGTTPDSVNGFGGAGGGLITPETSLTATIPAGTPPGRYQVRVIGVSASGAVGVFSDALTVVVE